MIKFGIKTKLIILVLAVALPLFTFSIYQVYEHAQLARSEALAGGDIDAFSQREPFISKAKGLLGDNAIVFAEPRLYFLTEGMIALNRLIKDKPEVINRLLRALLQAERFYKGSSGSGD